MIDSAAKVENRRSQSDGTMVALPPNSPRNLRLLAKVISYPFPSVPVEDEVPNESLTDRAGLKHVSVDRVKTRHIVIPLSFIAVVMLPVLVTSTYLGFWASDQYQSSSSFSVRSIEASSSADILGMFSQSSSGSTLADSYALLDFIHSEQMVEAVDERFGMENLFSPPGSDYYFRMAEGAPVEVKLEYWRRMVSVVLENASGIVTMKVRAFDPVISQRVSEFVIAKSEQLVNSLSVKGREEVVRSAQTELVSSEDRLNKARAALASYRSRSQEADPAEAAKLASQLVGSLEQQMVQLKTDLATALTQLSDDTPRVRVLRTQIRSLENQIKEERRRFGSGLLTKQGRDPNGSDVAGRIEQFQPLQTQNEFAERAYESALASLEKARIDAAAKQRYLSVFLQPSLSEMAQYPKKLMGSLLVGLGAMLLWGVSLMTYYNIRDRN